MADDGYRPVSCDYHDQLEAASVRRSEVELEFDDKGVRQRERGTIDDVYSKDGEEFVKLRRGEASVEVRLDHIVKFRELHEH